MGALIVYLEIYNRALALCLVTAFFIVSLYFFLVSFSFVVSLCYVFIFVFIVFITYVSVLPVTLTACINVFYGISQ